MKFCVCVSGKNCSHLLDMLQWHADTHWKTIVPTASCTLSHWSVPVWCDDETESAALYPPAPVKVKIYSNPQNNGISQQVYK